MSNQKEILAKVNEISIQFKKTEKDLQQAIQSLNDLIVLAATQSKVVVQQQPLAQRKPKKAFSFAELAAENEAKDKADAKAEVVETKAKAKIRVVQEQQPVVEQKKAFSLASVADQAAQAANKKILDKPLKGVKPLAQKAMEKKNRSPKEKKVSFHPQQALGVQLKKTEQQKNLPKNKSFLPKQMTSGVVQGGIKDRIAFFSQL